ncbi:cytochrome P450 1A1-like protein [Labeo rohita]|uniref:Cytochrome P450 1A n=1 Tax=Labeo rohita TaxID=84645 RepID=A0A498MGE6_LABRO|nr:cytochrome P450 1A1-like protein [Labeo rohita]
MPLLSSISVSESLLAIITVCLVYLLMRLMRTKIPEGLQKLPGPKPLPIIGNVLKMGNNPHLSLTAMSKDYGPVFQIQIGMRPVVVLSGKDVIHQALLKQGEEFAGRPDLYSLRFISNGKSLAFSTDQVGVWRTRRKLALSALRTFSTVRGKSSEYSCALEEHISKEGLYLIERLHKVMKADGCFDPFRHIVVSVANVICGICFGRRYSHDDDELLSLVNLSDEFVKIVGSGNPLDFIPFLRILPNKMMRKFLDLNAQFDKFVNKIVIDHYDTFDKDNIRDITDSLINHCEDRKLDANSNVQVSDEKVVGIVNDLFGAGFDTISTALSWAIVYLVNYPEIQERLQRELSDTSKDTSLNGYFIPKDTCVFVNQWQVNHDPELWKDPSCFNLDRFLTADGTDLNKTEGEKVLVFGLGKRRCLGESIGRAEVFLFLAILLQRLKFSGMPGETLDMTPEYGLTMKHKRCLLRVTPQTGFEFPSTTL